MKKKIFSFFLAFLLTLFSVGLVLAVDDSGNTDSEDSTTTPTSLRQKLQRTIELRKEQTQQKREEVKNKLTEMTRNRVQKLGEHAQNRLQKHLDRLNRITDDLEERVANLGAKGFSTAEATAEIAEARAALDKAETDLEAVNSKLNELLESENPQKAFTELRDEIGVVRENFKTSRTHLSQAVQSLKAQGGQNVD